MNSDLEVREGVGGRHLEEVILGEDIIDLAVPVKYWQTGDFERHKEVDSLSY